MRGSSFFKREAKAKGIVLQRTLKRKNPKPACAARFGARKSRPQKG